MSASEKQEERPVYHFHHIVKAPSLEPTLGVPAEGWQKAETATIDIFHRKSGPIHPVTYFRGLYDKHNLYIRFDVMDRYVKITHTKRNSEVSADSCVEFFIQPPPGPVYFNFEINGGGTLLLFRVTDPTRVNQGPLRDFRPVAKEWADQVEIHHSLPVSVRKAIQEPIAWTVAYRIPLALFAAELGSVSLKKGDAWRGNLFQCGGSDHWAMWSDVGRSLNYHQPKKFGTFIFD